MANAIDFNLGRDVQLVVQGPYGPVPLDNATKFDWKQDTFDVKWTGLDGKRHAIKPTEGWSGSFEVVRGSPALDEFFARQDLDWFTSGTLQYSNIYVYINEKTGGRSDWQLEGVSLSFEDAGSFEGDKEVRQKVSFSAQQRKRV